MPSVNANQTWTGVASFAFNFGSPSTVWLIGFLRVPVTTSYVFVLQTNADAILYLSSDENPNNKVIIASNYGTESSTTVLQSDTK